MPGTRAPYEGSLQTRIIIRGLSSIMRVHFYPKMLITEIK